MVCDWLFARNERVEVQRHTGDRVEARGTRHDADHSASGLYVDGQPVGFHPFVLRRDGDRDGKEGVHVSRRQIQHANFRTVRKQETVRRKPMKPYIPVPVTQVVDQLPHGTGRNDATA